MRQNLSHATSDIQIEQNVFIYPVIILLVVRVPLIGPDRFSRFRSARKNTGSPFVIAGTLLGIPGTWISRAVVDKVEIRIVGDPTPAGAAADLPRIAGPRVLAKIF